MATHKPLIITASGQFQRLPTSDTLELSTLGTGTTDNTTFLRGDGTWAVPSAEGSPGTDVPTGAVAAYAMNSVPTGWLAANGAVVSRTTYAALFAVIGTTYGVGDGSTTFALPDLRGYFVRGSGTNSDGTASGAFGAKQADEFKAHTHGVEIGSVAESGSGAALGTWGSTRNTTSAGGTETRPKNIAMLYCIKY